MMKTKFFLLSGMALYLTGCGFEPMYGTHRFNAPTAQETAIEKELEQIEISNIQDREGQYLRNLLIDRFYRTQRPQTPKYKLAVSKIAESITDLDITKQSDSTRAQLRLETSIALFDKTTNQELFTRKLVAIGSYNILASEFTTRVSEENTRKNVLNDLAQQIELQIALHFRSKE